MCSVAQCIREVTELLIPATRGLTTKQIAYIRSQLVQFGKDHGRAEDWASRRHFALRGKGWATTR